MAISHQHYINSVIYKVLKNRGTTSVYACFSFRHYHYHSFTWGLPYPDPGSQAICLQLRQGHYYATGASANAKIVKSEATDVMGLSIPDDMIALMQNVAYMRQIKSMSESTPGSRT